jgi:ABC-2 type transport system permease protein
MSATSRTLLFLAATSFRRQSRSRKVPVAVGLIGLSCLVILVVGMRREITPPWFGHLVVLELFAPFVFPMLLLSFGTGAIGDDREEKTLVYYLARPLPRWGIYLATLLGAAPVALGLALGGLCLLWLTALVHGTPGLGDALGAMVPAFLLGGAAYLSFFHLLAAVFRHATIAAIVYVLFIEAFLGTVPGIIKRISIRFYVASMVFDAGRPVGIQPPEDLVFQPIDGDVARAVLAAITAALLVLGMWVFDRREYHDPA